RFNLAAGTITSLGAVTAGTFNLGSGKFSVDVNGYLMATGVNISGTITDSTLTTGSGYPYEVNVGHGTITFTEIATGVTGTVAFGSNLDLSTSNVNYKVTVGGNEIWHAGNDPLGKGGTISFTDANADNWAITFSKGRCTSAKKNGTEQLT
ncbi:MAG: hypothetical protein M1378_13310, partial [Bacteroidetes bacterium]|nr:hypothetical protein [Bacteroidota bacterium]